MLRSLACLIIVVSASGLSAEDRMKTILQDDFERTESDNAREEIGGGWQTNSKSRAGGHKQADLADGTLRIKMHATADHAVSIRHDAAFQNGRINVRFKLENEKDSLGLNFADPTLKTVHAGHLFKVTVGLRRLEIADLKTGVMDLETRTARLAGKLSSERQEELKTKKKQFPVKLKQNQWHDIQVDVEGNKITVQLDGKPAGDFSSAGFAHPTKKMIRLAVPKEAVIDSIKMAAKLPENAPAN